MKVDTWGYEIISSKHLVGKCVKNGRHNMTKRFMWVRERDRGGGGGDKREQYPHTCASVCD